MACPPIGQPFRSGINVALLVGFVTAAEDEDG
jgi:hypothetical protein